MHYSEQNQPKTRSVSHFDKSAKLVWHRLQSKSGGEGGGGGGGEEEGGRRGGWPASSILVGVNTTV